MIKTLVGSRATRGRVRRSIAAVAVAAVTAALLVGVPSVAVTTKASAAEPLPDGLQMATAAGSCWEAKQNRPSAENGLYWLLTPTLKSPQQFYCDMSTDGGGWVLIGRGREAWKGYYQGLRPERVNNPVDGTGAFQPAQLPALTVDALLNGNRVDSLSDGVRLRRATNSAGTTWQESRFKFTSRDRWVWTVSAGHPLSTWRFDSSNGSNGNSSNFGNNNAFNRIDTREYQNQGYRWGWSFGSNVTGTNTSTTYLWSSSSGQGSAQPFTQVWLRPQLTIAGMDFGSIPDAGSAAITQRPLPESDAIRTVWALSGVMNGQANNEFGTEAQAFAQVGDTIFVGGNFASVRRTETSTGADNVAQPYLAGFDVNTGELLTTFEPTLNGAVKALAALPDGRLLVGGEFTNVNGQARSSVVALDPVTGNTAPGWQVSVENRTAGGAVQVRGFAVHDQWLYISGAFTHFTVDGFPTSSNWNGGRINTTTGKPDTNWNPALNGTTVGVDASVNGDRAYFAGYFKQSGAVFQPSVAPLDTTAGAPLSQPAWTPSFSKPRENYSGNIWQFVVKEAGDRVWHAGSEHMIFSYDRSSFDLLSGNVMNNGGDFQGAYVDNDVHAIYAGCHCGDWAYSESYTWSPLDPNWTQADKIDLAGAWDTQTGAFLPEFEPILQARRGFGVWAAFTDSNGTVWLGGDLSRSIRAGYVNQWSGGFARFAQRDAHAPTKPTSLTSTRVDGSTARLDWGASTDNDGSVTYEIIRGNRVIGTTTSRSFDVAYSDSPTRYFVRAADAAGNRSASTPVLTLTKPADALDFVASGGSWKWRFDSAPVDPGWMQPGFNDGSWATGNAFLGLGASGLGTDINAGAPSPRPLSAQFRKTFQVADPGAVKDATVSVVADDGVVVYVNGTEVGRKNLPAGAVSQNTYATAAPTAGSAAANRETFTVPSLLLVAGTNVVAAETHANYRSSPSLSFDLSMAATAGTPENPDPPAAPVVQAEAASPTSVELSWTPQAGTEAASYQVLRDGDPIATPDAATTSLTDDGLDPETEYTYQVIAVGKFGQESSPGTASVTTPADAHVVASGASWKWRFDTAPVDPGWMQPGFDDSSWATGDAFLGWGSASVGTDISAGAPSPRPLSAQFRHAFTVTDPGSIASVDLSVIADDGVVVYVNGTEVGRANLPAGTLTQNSYATAAPSATTAAANRVTFSVPGNLLTTGTNVVAAESHANYRSTPSLTFDLSGTSVAGTPQAMAATTPVESVGAQAPKAPAAVEGTATGQGIELNWKPADARATSKFVVLKDGEEIGTVAGSKTSFTDTEADPESTYEVRAVDEKGAQSQPANADITEE